MSSVALALALTLLGKDVQAAPGRLPPHLLPSSAVLEPLPLVVPPRARSTNCNPAVIAGAAVMVQSAAVFVRGLEDDDDPLKTGGAIGETIGAAVLIFGVSRPTCL
jgi:hypothetical protein